MISTRFIFCLGCVFTISIKGQTVSSCSVMSDPIERLACYDRIAQDLPIESREAETQSQPTSPIRRAREQIFGLELKQESKSQERDSMTAVVTSAKHNDFTGWSIEFDNGQYWKQIGTEDFRIKKGATYVITRGTLNSFFLGDGNSNNKIKVQRVR
jgi:hypothetical protein